MLSKIVCSPNEEGNPIEAIESYYSWECGPKHSNCLYCHRRTIIYGDTLFCDVVNFRKTHQPRRLEEKVT